MQFNSGSFAGTFSASSGQIYITNTTLNGPSISIGDNSGQNPSSDISIYGSTINALQGSGPAGGAQLEINGQSNTAGSAGVGISSSTITTDNAYIGIDGTGFLQSGYDSTGVLINNSTITVGSASAPGALGWPS